MDNKDGKTGVEILLYIEELQDIVWRQKMKHMSHLGMLCNNMPEEFALDQVTCKDSEAEE